MKNLVVFLIITFALSCISAFAQNKPDYSGEWILDKTNSKMGTNSKIESITVTAWQKTDELKVQTATRLSFASEESVSLNGLRVARVSVGDGIVTYNLNGQEKTIEADTQLETSPIKLMGYLQMDGKLNLISERAIMSPNGIISVLT